MIRSVSASNAEVASSRTSSFCRLYRSRALLRRWLPNSASAVLPDQSFDPVSREWWEDPNSRIRQYQSKEHQNPVELESYQELSLTYRSQTVLKAIYFVDVCLWKIFRQLGCSGRVTFNEDSMKSP